MFASDPQTFPSTCEGLTGQAVDVLKTDKDKGMMVTFKSGPIAAIRTSLFDKYLVPE